MTKTPVGISSPFWRKLSDISRNGLLAVISAALIVDLLQAAYTGDWPVVHLEITVVVAAIFGVTWLISNSMATRP